MVGDPRVQAVLDRAVTLLRDIDGIEAVVLGGSRARGTASPDSDIDIGIYYDGGHPPAIEALNEAATALDGEHRTGLVVPYGGWGNWVNAGGWLETDGYHVDFILRDLVRVRREVERCVEGQVDAHYQTGHPHAYLNVIYMGELAVCEVLLDRKGNVTPLQEVARQYPPKLQQALLRFFLFEAEFSCSFVENYTGKGDPYYATAHAVRSVSDLNQVLFARNEQYCLNEKKAVRMIDGFPVRPVRYADRVAAIMAAAGDETPRAGEALRALVEETKTLCAMEG